MPSTNINFSSVPGGGSDSVGGVKGSTNMYRTGSRDSRR